VTKKQLDLFDQISLDDVWDDANEKMGKQIKKIDKKEISQKKKVAIKALLIQDSYDASHASKRLNDLADHVNLIADSKEPVQLDDELFTDLDEEKTTPHVFSVSELTQHIKGMLEGEFRNIWISGEVTDYRNRTGRHLYFALKDEQKNKIRAALFNAASRKLSFDLEDGMEVLCQGNVNVYGPGGYYSIVINHIEPKGVGALQLAFEQIKNKLAAKGMFDNVHKKKIPKLPKRIGLITSPTGAAVRDMIHVLKRRFENIDIVIYPVRVQGDGAAEEIAHAITTMNQQENIDMLIVGRGGGSIEDLWAFNEEVIANAIFDSNLPIISAVGHEIDFTIADFVADLRAPTPSAAAELAVPVKKELQLYLNDREKRLVYLLIQGVVNQKKILDQYKIRLRNPLNNLPDLYRNVDQCKDRLNYAMQTRFKLFKQHIAQYTSSLNLLSPLAVLEKGYSVITTTDNKVVKSKSQVSLGDQLNIQLHDGRIQVEVMAEKCN